MNIGKPGTGIGTSISERDQAKVLHDCKDILMSQPMCVELEPPLCICGDIHGQFSDLMRIFNKTKFPNETNYLFLGDYVDRGRMNLETILYLVCCKVKYPQTFFILRGNHETSIVNRIYGFYEEIVRRYQSPRLYQLYQEVFDCMPLTALVGGRILCMHGGLSPEMWGTTMPLTKLLNSIHRPLQDPPNPSLPLDLLWADPDLDTRGYRTSVRGVSCTFGEMVVNKLTEKFDIDMIVRAHQVVQDGYEFFANRKLVTIFSAPHYCGQFDNAAAVMTVSESLECSFKIFRPKFPREQDAGHEV
ncbi:calcineurin-like phosphoesterase domain-containing protein [Ditylenchus destructor]|nr:calcineurin-like phosphoesterase domain-containing protein [Ditylenchus destructor]